MDVDEAFDYLIGETTQPFAIEAIHAAAVMLSFRLEHPGHLCSTGM